MRAPSYSQSMGVSLTEGRDRIRAARNSTSTASPSSFGKGRSLHPVQYLFSRISMASSRALTMQPLQILRMQPTTALKMRPAQALMMQHTRTLMMKPTQTLRVQPTQSLGMRPTRPMMRPTPVSESNVGYKSFRHRTDM